MLVEHAEAADLPLDFDEREPFSIRVLAPVRTLAEKLVILHHAAIDGDDARKARVARHYYDIERLLDSDVVRNAFASDPCDVLAREVCRHSEVAGLEYKERPQGGFAASPAFDPATATVARAAYRNVVVPQLIWPSATPPTFEDCCQTVRRFEDLL